MTDHELPSYCPVCDMPSLPDREECRECAEWADLQDQLAAEETAREEDTGDRAYSPKRDYYDTGIDEGPITKREENDLCTT